MGRGGGGNAASYSYQYQKKSWSQIISRPLCLIDEDDKRIPPCWGLLPHVIGHMRAIEHGFGLGPGKSVASAVVAGPCSLFCWLTILIAQSSSILWSSYIRATLNPWLAPYDTFATRIRSRRPPYYVVARRKCWKKLDPSLAAGGRRAFSHLQG